MCAFFSSLHSSSQRNVTAYHVYDKSLQRWNVRLRPLAVFQVTPLLKSVDDLQFSSSAHMQDVCSGFYQDPVVQILHVLDQSQHAGG